MLSPYGSVNINGPECALPPDEDQFKASIAWAQENGYEIGGSMGRAATFGALLGDPLYEVRKRGEYGLLTKIGDVWVARDTDIFGKPPLTDAEQLAFSPHTLDSEGLYTPRLRLIRDGCSWELHLRERGAEDFEVVELDPTMFATVEGFTFCKTPCRTLSAATHFALLTSKKPEEKYRRAQSWLFESMPTEQRRLLETDSYKQFMDYLLQQ